MKKTRENNMVFYVVSDMMATLEAQNVGIINATTELQYNDMENVTYQMLYTDRLLSMGGNHCGKFVKKDGVSFWVLPTPVEMDFTIKEGNTDITEYTYNEYRELVWDIEAKEL